MSNLMGQSQGRTAATTQPEAMGIDLQGAQYGPPVPVVYGQNRVGGNVIWYGDFKATQQTQKVGKGFGGATSSSYTYQASYLNGLCEGPIIGIANVWSGNSIVLLSTLAPFSATGTASQAPWSALPSPANLSYAYTALFGVDNMALGGSPTLPNYNYEVAGLLQFGSGILDANPSAILTDICSSTTHGVPFNYLGSLTQYSDYCVANGLFLSPVYDQQSTAVQVLTDLFKNTNTYAYWSEGQLKVVPLGDATVTGNGVTYTPNITPIVNLGAGDFIVSGQASPVQVQRKAPQDCYNAVSIQFTDRANTYHNSAVVASIDEDMIANGARMSQTANVNGCVTAAVARFIAQNMVQLAYFVRNQYKFKLSWRYCYLEPTDIVTLTDVNTGLSNFPVRILEVSEDADGLLDITAEEFPEGIGQSALYNTQPNGGTNLDPMSDPGPVNAPLLFRGPGFLCSPGSPQIWCAVCGSGAYWGGAEVYLSHDGTSYTQVGIIGAPARYGTLTSDLPQPPPADPDTTTTLGVQLYAPGQLLGGSQADADNLVTLCIAGSEVFAYENAALTGANAYNLTYLRRNAYGTSNPATVGSGEFFARLDDAIFRIPVDPSLIGSTIYLKFLSLNVFGKTPRTLAEETAYTYTVGASVELPDVPPTPTGFAAVPIADGVSLTWTNPIPAAVSSVAVYRSANATSGFSVVAELGPTANTWADHFTNGATWYYYLKARGPLISSGWSAPTSTISSTGKTVADGATVGATLGTNLVQSNGTTVISTLDQFPNGTGRFAVTSIDGNGRAGIDFLQSVHLNKNIDNVGDGTTYYRMPGANMDANRRGLIDFSQGGHLGKVLDNIGDTGSYVRTPATSWHPENVPNASFASPAVNGAVPGWGAVNATLSIVSAGGPRALQVVAIAGGVAGAYFTPSNACQPGDVVSATVTCDVTGGNSVTARLQVQCFDGNGNALTPTGNYDVAVTSAYNTFATATALATMPANAASFRLFAYVISNAGATFLILNPRISVNDLRVAGSGAKIGDQRNLPQGAVNNFSATYSGFTPSYSTTTTNGNGVCTFDFPAFTADLTAGGSPSYGATSAQIAYVGTVPSGGASTGPYYFWYTDPTYSGGNLTLNYSTNIAAAQGAGNIFLGAFMAYYVGSGSYSNSYNVGAGGSPDSRTKAASILEA
ncbi:MAG: phage tail protein [Betaproteobacteria bacterium]|nr:phage tail protein [Betaproteobacteria bacterium]